MLDFIYVPISGVMLFWYEVLAKFMDKDSGWTWALSIILLTVTIKALLLWPTMRQMTSMRRMAQLSPKIQEIRERYKHDQTKMAAETQRIYKEAKVNPVAGCLPMLIQIPVFIGLFHVLRSFNRTGEGYGGLGMTVEENRTTANYLFDVDHVQSFLDARLFGVPLSSAISMGQDQLASFQPVDFTRMNIVLVAVPMIIFVAVVTHFNARISLARQKSRQQSGKVSAPTGDNAEMMMMQQEMMGKMMLWVMPAFTIMTGYIWSIGLLIYMSTNVLWSAVQMKLLYDRMDKEEAREEQEKAAVAASYAPQVGARKVVQKPKASSQEETFNERIKAMPPIDEKDKNFIYLSNAERKALGMRKRQDYDLDRDSFERRNPEIAELAAEAGATGLGRQWVLDEVKKHHGG